MKHSKAYLKYNEYIHIKRKQEIIRNIGCMTGETLAANKASINGKLRKGKVHCSCSMCRKKTHENGWKASDKKKIEKCNHQINELRDLNTYINCNDDIFLILT